MNSLQFCTIAYIHIAAGMLVALRLLCVTFAKPYSLRLRVNCWYLTFVGCNIAFRTVDIFSIFDLQTLF
jgi:hypothetical protein